MKKVLKVLTVILTLSLFSGLFHMEMVQAATAKAKKGDNENYVVIYGGVDPTEDELKTVLKTKRKVSKVQGVAVSKIKLNGKKLATTTFNPATNLKTIKDMDIRENYYVCKTKAGSKTTLVNLYPIYQRSEKYQRGGLNGYSSMNDVIAENKKRLENDYYGVDWKVGNEGRLWELQNLGQLDESMTYQEYHEMILQEIKDAGKRFSPDYYGTIAVYKGKKNASNKTIAVVNCFTREYFIYTDGSKKVEHYTAEGKLKKTFNATQAAEINVSKKNLYIPMYMLQKLFGYGYTSASGLKSQGYQYSSMIIDKVQQNGKTVHTEYFSYFDGDGTYYVTNYHNRYFSFLVLDPMKSGKIVGTTMKQQLSSLDRRYDDAYKNDVANDVLYKWFVDEYFEIKKTGNYTTGHFTNEDGEKEVNHIQNDPEFASLCYIVENWDDLCDYVFTIRDDEERGAGMDRILFYGGGKCDELSNFAMFMIQDILKEDWGLCKVWAPRSTGEDHAFTEVKTSIGYIEINNDIVYTFPETFESSEQSNILYTINQGSKHAECPDKDPTKLPYGQVKDFRIDSGLDEVPYDIWFE